MSDLATAAIKAAMANDWAKAIELNLQILKTEKDDVDALCRLARAYIETNKKDLATKTIKQIFKENPYNPIAQKLKFRLETGPGICTDQHSSLIEEPGKTKTMALINLAPPKIIGVVECAQNLVLEAKRHTVYVNDSKGKYLGSLPDDIGKRLNILMNGGNTYECLVKSITAKDLIVFIRELSRCKKYADFPSFPAKYIPGEQRENPRADDLPVFAEDQPKKKSTEDEEDEASPTDAIHADEESSEES